MFSAVCCDQNSSAKPEPDQSGLTNHESPFMAIMLCSDNTEGAVPGDSSTVRGSDQIQVHTDFYQKMVVYRIIASLLFFYLFLIGE